MNIAYLLIGGNMGARLAHLEKAREGIARDCGPLAAASGIYETEAWGLQDQPPFLNQALEVHTGLAPAALLQAILAIEQSLGRRRQEKYGPRLIDIDILLYNDAVIHTEGLKVPHPELANRRFALQCLADIAAERVHPVLGQSIARLLYTCPDPLKVYKFN